MPFLTGNNPWSPDNWLNTARAGLAAVAGAAAPKINQNMESLKGYSLKDFLVGKQGNSEWNKSPIQHILDWVGRSPVQGQDVPDPNQPQANKPPDLQPTPQPDTMSVLMDQLLNSIYGGNGVDTSALDAQARQIANSQIDPQIAALQNAMGQARANANRNSAIIGDMFSQLSSSLKGDIPGINQRYDAANTTVNAQNQAAQTNIDQIYADIQAQQQALADKLNLQAALPEGVAQQNSNKAFLESQNAQSNADTLAALQMLKQGDVGLTQNYSQIASAEGPQRQADLMAQLQNYLNSTNSQVAGLEGQRQQAYQQALSSLMSSAQSQQNNTFDQLLGIAKLQAQLQGQQSQNQPTYRSGPLAASQYLGQTTDPQNASRLNAVLLSVLQDPRILGGRIEVPGPNGIQSVPITPEAAASIAQQIGSQQGLNPQEQQMLYMAMMAYQGKLGG